MGDIRISPEAVEGLARLLDAPIAELASCQGRILASAQFDTRDMGLASLQWHVRTAGSAIGQAQNRIVRLQSVTRGAAARYRSAEALVNGRVPGSSDGGLTSSPTDLATRLIEWLSGLSDVKRLLYGSQIERDLILTKWAKAIMPGLLSGATSHTARSWLAREAPNAAKWLGLGPRGGVGTWSQFIDWWSGAQKVLKASGTAALFSGVIGGALELFDSIGRRDSAARTTSNVILVGGSAAAAGAIGAAVGSFIPVPIVGTLVGAAVGVGVGMATDWAMNTKSPWLGGRSVKDAVGTWSEQVAAPAIGKAATWVGNSAASAVGAGVQTLSNIGGSITGAVGGLAGAFGF